MYVVRRVFRHLNQMVTPGSVVEPGSIKNFKGRLRDRFIVEVTEQDFNKWNEYFKTKYGTPIKLPKPAGHKDPVDEPGVPVEPTKPTSKPAPKTAVTVKAK